MARKKKDPEAPYSDNPTPGKPGWNLAKQSKKNKDVQSSFNKGYGNA
tara:strand:- start:298 stop:438 length:141 start_codon:yes stop_codon:yes gene_type:complete